MDFKSTQLLIKFPQDYKSSGAGEFGARFCFGVVEPEYWSLC